MSLRCVFLAFGTTGDVLPLLALALHVQKAGCCELTFITHAAHEPAVREPAEAGGVARLVLVDTPPGRVWQTGSAGSGAKRKQPDKRVSSQQQQSQMQQEVQTAALFDPELEERQREACIAACEEAFGRALSPAQPLEQQWQREEPAPPPGLIVFNLFALEGFSIAEALAVPCAAASPCLPPQSMPPSLERSLERAEPRLYDRLSAAAQIMRQRAVDDSEPTATAAGSQQQQPVSLSEVKLWLWPLFTERWGAWRQTRLGLPLLPFSTGTTDQPLPPPPPLLLGEGRWRGVGARMAAIPMADASVHALHAGLSELVVQGQGHWPPSVRLCGFWHSAAVFPASQQQLPPDVVRWLQARQEKPVAADFGSMARLGLLPNPSLAAEVLAGAARRLGRPIVLLAGGWRPLVDAARALDQEWLAVLEHPVAHDALLPRCAALLHHGGAGTVAAALRAGVPQLICPLLRSFDQQSNAERVAWSGWGAQLSPSAICLSEGFPQDGTAAVAIGANELAAALVALLSDVSIAAACRLAAQQLAKEDGICVAARLLLEVGAGPPLSRPPPEVPVSAADLTPPVSLLMLPNGLEVECISPSEALFIYKEIWERRCYAQHSISLLPGAVIVDVGANLGLFCLWALQEQPDASHVYAFEPLAPLAGLAERNLAASGLAGRVTVVRAGLGATAGTRRFTFFPHMPGNSTAHPREKWVLQGPAMRAGASAFEGAATVDCTVTTLAAFVRERQQAAAAAAQQRRQQATVQQQRRQQGCASRSAAPFVIDLLKIDVEGSELEVLRGLDSASWACVQAVAAEVHASAGRPAAVARLLQSRGFAVEAEAGAAPGATMVYARRVPES